MLEIITFVLVVISAISLIVNLIVKKENSELKSDFNKEIGFIKSAVNNIVTALENYGIKVKQPYFKSESPKKITERGYELLNKLNLSSYLDANCDLLTDKELKNKTDVKIFIKCFDWVKDKGKEKVFEIRFNSDMNQEESNELLALFILDKIRKQAPDS